MQQCFEAASPLSRGRSQTPIAQVWMNQASASRSLLPLRSSRPVPPAHPLSACRYSLPPASPLQSAAMARAAALLRRAFVFAAVALLLSPAALADDASDVITLTAANFDAVVNKEKIIAVEFYAPWCGHCKSLAPEWEKAATELKDQGIKLAKVDATEESALGSRFDVSGYPTIKLFRNGKASEYNGPRQAAGIVNYMIDQASPGARKVSAAELATLRSALRDDAPDVVVVLFAAKASDVEGGEGLFAAKATPLAEAFSATAAKLRESFTFAWSADADAAAAVGAKPGTVAVLHSPLVAGKNEPALVTYSGAASAEALEAWVGPASLPRAGELTQRTAPRYASAGGALVRVALPTDWRSDAKGANYWLNRLRRVAAARPTLRIVSVKPTSPLAALADYGVDAKPEFSVTATQEGRKYAMAGPWDPKAPEESVKAFLDALEAGSLEAHVKSGPLPEGGLEGGVSVLVGKNFDALGLDADKDVLLEFYAPWCGHCKTLAPKYEELAQGLAGVPSVRIAKLDATANDWAHKDSTFAVQGFPTLYFKPAGADGLARVVKYEGAREAPAMAAWLAEHATTRFAVPAALSGGAPAPAKKKKAPKAKAEAEAPRGAPTPNDEL